MVFKYLLVPFMVPHIVLYIYSGAKQKINQDLTIFSNEYWGVAKTGTVGIKLLVKVLLFCPEYRNVFYVRIGKSSRRLHIGFFLEMILPRYRFLSIGTPADKIGGGMFIQHGNSTIIHARSIGSNSWFNQNVTIGDNGRGIPEIGDNVRVGTGAVVLGPIKIGNNVVIGANATVVKDIPDNCTVIPSPSYIIKKNGVKSCQKI